MDRHNFYSIATSLYHEKSLTGILVFLNSGDPKNKVDGLKSLNTAMISDIEMLPRPEKTAVIAIEDYWHELPELLNLIFSDGYKPLLFMPRKIGLQDEVRRILSDYRYEASEESGDIEAISNFSPTSLFDEPIVEDQLQKEAEQAPGEPSRQSADMPISSVGDKLVEIEKLEELIKELETKLQKTRILYYGLLESKWTKLGFFIFGQASKNRKLLFRALQALYGKTQVLRRKASSTSQKVKGRHHGSIAGTGAENDKYSWKAPSRESWELSVKGWAVDLDEAIQTALTVLDEFSETSFQGTINVVNPRPDNWYGLAMKVKPDLILVESAWNGNGGSWQYRVGSYGFPPGPELRDLITWARNEGIPTVFWNKEDPVHFDKFIEAAKLFDFIYTSDENSVPRYNKETNVKSVKSLMFAANPSIHRPSPMNDRYSKVGFAGSWYGSKYPKRSAELEELLRAGSKFGLDIFDRNHGSGRFEFPEEFQPYVRGSKTYEDMCKEYRKYRAFLNVNTVTDSPTMFSRRVFELLASGTPVISNESAGIRRVFDEKVAIVNRESDASAFLERYINDETYWKTASFSGTREVLRAHTYQDRVNEILSDIGSDSGSKGPPRLLLIGLFVSDLEIDEMSETLGEQSYKNFDFVSIKDNYAKLAKGLSGNNFDFLLSDNESEIDDLSGYDVVGIMSPKNVYGIHYLQDLVNGMKLQPDAQNWSIAQDPGSAWRFSESLTVESSLMKPVSFLPKWRDYKNLGTNVFSSESFLLGSDQFF